ncbi:MULTISPECIES: hypothetical protein [unclassified Imperialibacter]|uniref:hypothetical protein n=1 Tax=unclassified Imperialibacter TaxID=2629706 RepID=UPI00125A102B|nr:MULTISPECIES: hypothetical protein [unclassified Imperialibacter]CAD5270657.1 hypothetical protein IMPERIA89_340442 [Imperialibacter sp. 89]CAD5298351.1 hypothetical protein IMPERIA75_700441 [Imperialibacter sp. 75]VVT34877.1 hypothetical protein IMPR6_700036 [Imperialibacter sp. EC-SDR9]
MISFDMPPTIQDGSLLLGHQSDASGWFDSYRTSDIEDPLTEPVYSNIKYNIIKSRIISFLSFSDNWDGYGAIKPLHKTIYNSILFATLLPDSLLENLDIDEISPTPYGTIVIDFKGNGSLISVEIGEDEVGFFSEIFGKEGPKSTGEKINPHEISQDIITVFKEAILI